MPKTKLIFGRSFIEIGVFSIVTNVLLLVQPLYMLQIYDRVVPSASLDTLIYLSLFALGALAVLGVMEVVRALYANRVASRLDRALGASAFLAALNGPRAELGDVQPLRDLSTIRTLIASRSLFFLFDLPFTPFFVLFMYFIHPVLFWITLAGMVVMVAIALVNQMATSKLDRQAAEALTGAMSSAQSFIRNAETVRALGMTENAVELWGDRFSQSIGASDRVARTNAVYGGISRTIRIFLQIAILGAGGYLVLAQEMTAGMIFASSMISGRALQPLDQIIGGWRQLTEAGRAWKRLSALSARNDARVFDIDLPAPVGSLVVDQLVYFLPNADSGAPPLIKRVSFAVQAGEAVALIGPSQAGKSTLARLIVGAIRPRSGVVRIDGADVQNWDSDELGKHIGYMSQDVELFPGTIAQNISRFEPDAPDEKVIEAAKLACVHELVLGQKNGYQTLIGPSGVRLSGGERQRIGLARAFYGNPRLVMLDEPNANLDTEGEAALERAILDAKQRKTTVLLITHRPSIAQKCDRVVMMRDGQIEQNGPAAEVLRRLQPGQRQPQSAPSNVAIHPGAMREANQAMPSAAQATTFAASGVMEQPMRLRPAGSLASGRDS